MKTEIKQNPREQLNAEKQRFRQRNQVKRGCLEEPEFIEKQINLIQKGKQKILKYGKA